MHFWNINFPIQKHFTFAFSEVFLKLLIFVQWNLLANKLKTYKRVLFVIRIYWLTLSLLGSLFVENKYFTHKTFTEAMEKSIFRKKKSPESFLFVVVVMQLCIRYNMRRIWSGDDCCWSRMHCEICWDASTQHLLSSCHHPSRKYLTTTHSRKYLSCWLWKIFEVWQKCWYLSVRHSHPCHLAQDDTSIKEEQIISLKM